MNNKTTEAHRSTLAVAGTCAAAMLGFAYACNQGADFGSSSVSGLSGAIVAETSASGTLICAPSQIQVDACSGLAVNDSCSLSSADGSTTIAGTCRATVDGKTVACAPNPPGPPQALVDACAAKAKGDACSVTEPDGDVLSGGCGTLSTTTALVCLRVRTPPQIAIDACTGLFADDACTLPGHDGETIAGTCSTGPTGLAALACSPTHVRADATDACSGLSDGVACRLDSHRDSVTGSCITPVDGGAAVCVVACAELRGRFDCGPDRGRGGRGRR